MFLRYSSSVVAPIKWSSPRARAGFSMLPASIAPSAAPAPTTVCSSSRKTISSSAFSVISSITFFSRSSNSPRYFVPATIPPRSSATRRLPVSVSGYLVVDDPLRDPLHDRRLPDARIAEQYGIVLRPPREDLDRLLDLVRAADHRVELPLARRLGEVAAVLVEGLRRARRPAAALGRLHAADHRAAQLRVRDSEAREQLAGRILLVASEREQDVLGPDVGGAELPRLVVGGEKRGLRVRRERRRDIGALRLLGLVLDLARDRLGVGTDLRAARGGRRRPGAHAQSR